MIVTQLSDDSKTKHDKYTNNDKQIRNITINKCYLPTIKVSKLNSRGNQKNGTVMGRIRKIEMGIREH